MTDATGQPAQATPPNAGPRKPTLLVVDDNRIIFTFVQKAFCGKNSVKIDVLYAANGKQGIKLLRELKPDLVLLDWAMPDYNGDYFLKAQAEEPLLARVPVLVYSAKNDKTVATAPQRYPVVKELVAKPCPPSKLNEIVVRHLKSAGLVQQKEA